MAGAVVVVGILGSPQEWAPRFRFYVEEYVPAFVVRVLHDPSGAFDGVDVVVLDDTLSFLSARQVAELRRSGVRVVGVYDPSGRHGKGKAALERLGVDASVAVTDGPEALVDVVADLPTGRARNNGVDRDHASSHDSAGRESGKLVVVSGGPSSGKTEVGGATAGEIARRGYSVLLVDLDEHNPSVGRRFGYRLTPNVLDAISAAVSDVDLTSQLAQRQSTGGGTVGFDVVTGLANPADWAQLHEITVLLTAARREWEYVVVDTGPACAPEPVAAGERNAATRLALADADHVIAVCDGTRSGLLRFFDWASHATELIAAPVTVAINRSPTDGFRRGELVGQLTENLPTDLSGDICFVPHDDGLAEADWDASPARKGPFSAAAELLVDRLAAKPPAPARGLARLRQAVGVGR